MKTLRLTLKKKWFDMIASGEKKEEYRDIKEYCYRILVRKLIKEQYSDFDQFLSLYDCMERWSRQMIYNHYDQVQFRNGSSKDAPTITLVCKSITINEGKPKWGAVDGQKDFVIELGNIVKPN